ncbi:MAG: 50S ribosomal protein L32e [Candidatus Aenigmarchaeota archaeon]|nr:50S ribosomal protein L32e [Candidatus Aenigmarchaeota archaeon]
MKQLLKVRRKAKRKKPTFKRQEQFKHRKLKKKWRRPRGKQSKLRKGEKARGKKPSPGYSSPRKIRALGPSGIPTTRISSPKELDAAKGKEVIIASTVGKRKRNEILKKAEKLGLKVSNI